MNRLRELFAALRALVYAVFFLGAWAWLALQARALDAVLGLGTLPAGSRPAAWVLLVAGGATALGCAATFVWRGEGGTPAPFDPPRAFVAVGPYRWVRNPMYLGGVALLAGFGLWHRSPSMTAFAGVFLLAAHLFVRFREEPKLEERFGEAYREYRRRVNRWVPKPPRDGGDRTADPPAA